MRVSSQWGISLLSVAAVCAVAAAGSASQHETLVKDMLAAVDEITKELSQIKDAKDAEAARPKLKATAARLLELRKKADDVKQPDKTEKDRIAKQYKEKFDASLKKLSDERARVKNIPGGEEALKEIAILNKKKPKK